MPKRRSGPSRLAQSIRAHRESVGLSRRQLAEKVGCSAGYIGQIERGDKIVSYETSSCLARALGLLAPESFYQFPPAPDAESGE